MGELGLGCYQGQEFVLWFRLRNVTPGHMPSLVMLYITFRFKCPLCSYVLCIFWNKLLIEKYLYFSLASQTLVLLWCGHPFLDQTEEWVAKDMWPLICPCSNNCRFG